MLGLSRTSRLFLLVLALVIIPTLYLLHPSSPNPFTRQDATRVEAGGIDSNHWRDPVIPEISLEETEDVPSRDDALRQGQTEHEELRDIERPLDAVQPSSTPSKVLEESVPGVIMPKMTNATAKAELGRAAWRVLHLMTLRYPETPTQDDRDALKSYFHLFAQLYPCGECAAEFQALLKQYPPQTSSRKTASLWLCYVHNLINERLGKPEFDCLTLDATYDCGCGPEGDGVSTSAGVVGAVQTTAAYDAE